MAKLMTADEITGSLKQIPDWKLSDRSVVRELSFKNFIQAIDFVNQVAKTAEARDHHPDIFISYNKVKLSLSTHSAGGLTLKDFDLAAEIDRLA